MFLVRTRTHWFSRRSCCNVVAGSARGRRKYCASHQFALCGDSVRVQSKKRGVYGHGVVAGGSERTSAGEMLVVGSTSSVRGIVVVS